MLGSGSMRLARAAGRFLRSRPARVAWPAGAVSFTFRDFPKSALATGGALLEKHGRRGTYYAALGLAGTTGDMGPIGDADDIRVAHRAGHELACHTYSHLNCASVRPGRIVSDIA